MKMTEGRRSFLFGVGAFATSILLPKAPRLIFPVQNNPLVLAPDASPLTGGNRIGNRRVYVWMMRNGNRIEFYQKFGAPPEHAGDGELVPAIVNQEARRRFAAGDLREIREIGNANEVRWLPNSRSLEAELVAQEARQKVLVVEECKPVMLPKAMADDLCHEAHRVEYSIEDGYPLSRSAWPTRGDD